MPWKYIIVYDILGVFVTVHPICRNPAHQLAIRKKNGHFKWRHCTAYKCYFVNIICFSYSS